MIYIILADLFSIGYMGIKKKVFAQIKVFVKRFSPVYYTSYNGQMIYLMFLSFRSLIHRTLILQRTP